MRTKVIIGLLVLAVLISMGLNYYYYSEMISTTTSKQKTINNMLGRIIVGWAMQMGVGSYYLKNATTGVDLLEMREIFHGAYYTALAADISHGSSLYYHMALTASDLEYDLIPYATYEPRTINSTAIAMIKDLAKKIHDMITPIMYQETELTGYEGNDPVDLLGEKGILNSTINYCSQIRNMSAQINAFNPKF
jgi:hypothetical protein